VSLFGELRVCINPGLSKIYYEAFRILGSFETISQAVNCVRVTLAINFPSDFCARTPEFAALLKRRIGDNEPLIVKQICHAF
jgi:hypothetical protein